MSCDSFTIPLIFEPIPADELHEIRAAGLDEAGNRLTAQTNADGGSPLRYCLRESCRGECCSSPTHRPARAAPLPNAAPCSSTPIRAPGI